MASKNFFAQIKSDNSNNKNNNLLPSTARTVSIIESVQICKFFEKNQER